MVCSVYDVFVMYPSALTLIGNYQVVFNAYLLHKMILIRDT